MKRCVVTGVGFVLPYGVGSSAKDLNLSKEIVTEPRMLSGGEKLFHFDIDDLRQHPFYPDRKELRHMRLDAVYATIATGLALESANLEGCDHTNTAYYTSTGQCYGDMSPFINAGLEASRTEGVFDLQKFGTVGRTRVNPFFSIRTLGALPMAITAQRAEIHGENYVNESFGAESVAPLRDALSDIQQGNSTLAIVAAQDFLLNTAEMDNLYFNEYYEGDFYGSSSATVLILEEAEHNWKRGGTVLGEIIACEQHFYPVNTEMEIAFPQKPFEQFVKLGGSGFDQVHLTASGTDALHQKEIDAVTSLFPEAVLHDYFEKFGGLLAGSEPFGTLMHLVLGEGRGLSLSRSVCGLEGAVVIDKGVAHV